MSSRLTLFRIATAGLTATVVGSLAPWATMLGFTINGPDVHGLYTLGFAVAAALALWRGWVENAPDMLLGCAAFAGVALAISVYNFQRISRGPSAEDLGGGEDLASVFAQSIASTMTVGWGLYVVLLGSAGATVAALGAWRFRRTTLKNQPFEAGR